MEVLFTRGTAFPWESTIISKDENGQIVQIRMGNDHVYGFFLTKMCRLVHADNLYYLGNDELVFFLNLIYFLKDEFRRTLRNSWSL